MRGPGGIQLQPAEVDIYTYTEDSCYLTCVSPTIASLFECISNYVAVLTKSHDPVSLCPPRREGAKEKMRLPNANCDSRTENVVFITGPLTVPGRWASPLSFSATAVGSD